MKKYILSIVTLVICTSAFAQIKIINGKVGIGDITPAVLFTVGNGDLFRVNSSGYIRTITGSASLPAYSFVADSTMGMFISTSAKTGGGNPYHLGFATNGLERIRILKEGQVGINGDDVSAQFFVKNSSNTYRNAMIIDQNYNAAALVVDTKDLGDTVEWNHIILAQANSSNTKAFTVNLDTVNNFVVYGDGQTMIGGQNGSYKLYVNGTIKCTTLYQGSDIRYKKNIQSIDDAAYKLQQIRGVHFEYNKKDNPAINFDQTSSYGVIAQEIEPYFPELVKTDSLGYKGVNYTGLIPILIEAIKEQTARINIMEQRLEYCCNGSSSENTNIDYDQENNEVQAVQKEIEGNKNNLRKAFLYQNTPNPFSAKTKIQYFLSDGATNAAILLFDMQGLLLKTYSVQNQKDGYIEIFGGELKPGMYLYSLIADGKEIDTKKMILTE